MNYTAYNEDEINVLLDCEAAFKISIYLVLLFFLSIFFNFINIWQFFKKRILFSSMNYFMSILIIFNLLTTVIILPTTAYSAFTCTFNLGRIGCIIQGFAMYFTGTLSIYLLVVVSVEKTLLLQDLMTVSFITKKYKGYITLFCALFALLWCIFPLFGWSQYSIEGIRICCSVDWTERTFNVISYNIAIMIFIFLIPLIIILFTNVKVIRLLAIIMRDLKRITSKNDPIQKKFKKRQQVTIVSILTVVFYIISWTPYAIVCIYVSFIAKEKVDPLIITIPGLFAKLSLLWPAFINVLINKDLRKVAQFWRNESQRRLMDETKLTYRLRRPKPRTTHF